MKCPDCKTTLRNAALRCKCGWRAADAVHADPERKQRFDAQIEQANAAAAAYCAANGLKTIDQMREHLFAKLPKAGEEEFRGLNWAQAIMDRLERGETVSLAAEDAARRVLRRPHRQREPGEDESEAPSEEQAREPAPADAPLEPSRVSIGDGDDAAW